MYSYKQHRFIVATSNSNKSTQQIKDSEADNNDKKGNCDSNWQGFKLTPATSTAMSIVQIGGFYTDNLH